jgi:hypothetical protein
MKFDNSTILIGIILVVLVVLYLRNKRSVAPAPQVQGDASASDQKSAALPWTVYGTRKCGWTVKQLKNLQEKKVPHKFVDCETEDCSFVEAFPTVIKPDGTKVVGFTEVS